MKILSACQILLLIAALCMPGAAAAAPAQNEIGMYTTPTGGQPYISPVVPSALYTIHFVVTNPTMPDGTGPMPSVSTCQFKVHGAPMGYWFVLATTRPYGCIDVGLGYDSTAGTWDYALELMEPLPVVGGTVKVLEWLAMFLTTGPFEFTLGPGSDPAIPGAMAVSHIRNGVAYFAACTPSSGSFDRPVFAAGSMIVPDEPVAFGSVKALYR